MRVRVGIHAGAVLRDGDDLFGETVILARRISDRARPGEILVSREVWEAVGHAPGAVSFVDRGRFWLKGFHGAVQLFEIAWQGRRADLAPRAFVPPPVERAPGDVPLVGRCYRDLASPYEPVLDCMRHLLASGLRIDGAEGELESLRSLLWIAPDLGSHLPGGSSPERATEELGRSERRLRLLNAIASLFLTWARQRSIVLVFDDLQFADAQSLELLRILLRRLLPMARIAASRMLVLATLREKTEATDSEALEGLRLELRRSGVGGEREVGGLAPEDLRLLLRDVGGGDPGRRLTAAIARRSQSNPLFVQEILGDALERAREAGRPWDPLLLAEPEGRVPPSVRQIIEQRLARLGPQHRDALEVAARLGDAFSVELLAEALGRPLGEVVGWLEAAVRAHVLRWEGGGSGAGYRFAHGLMAEALALGSPERAAGIHLRIAQVLEKRLARGDGARVQQVARHLMAARPRRPPRRCCTPRGGPPRSPGPCAPTTPRPSSSAPRSRPSQRAGSGTIWSGRASR